MIARRPAASATPLRPRVAPRAWRVAQLACIACAACTACACSRSPSPSSSGVAPGPTNAGDPGDAGGRERPACVVVAEAEKFGPDATAAIRVEVVARGLEVPWSIAFLPDGDLLVTERPGRVRRVDLPSGALGPVVATLEGGAAGEGGTLGLALDPEFATSRRFFVYATRDRGDGGVNRIERFVLDSSGASARSDGVVFDDIPGAKYHDGGRLRFGPDGFLYVGTGDARRPELARDRASAAGKILRLTRDGGRGDCGRDKDLVLRVTRRRCRGRERGGGEIVRGRTRRLSSTPCLRPS